MLTKVVAPLLFLILVHAVPDPLLTFSETDPVTGKSLVCDRCPPGTYLRARCTENQKSACAPCPQGSFTELWNYISKCLRCSPCAHNQVVKSACTAERDCECECRAGYYYSREPGMCLRHRDCPTGQEALTAGTPDEDTVCHTCPNGTFSDVVSAQKTCVQHRSCEASGLQVALKGSVWHDSVCVSCQDATSQDSAKYLKQILPSFFAHHSMALRKLRSILRHMLRADGKKHDHVLDLELSELQTQINSWVASASAEQIRQLPSVFARARAHSAAERLKGKLSRMDAQVSEVCGLNNRVEPL